jgi:xylan 1,4-beta-xylosidase
VWNFHEDDVPGTASPVALTISGLGADKVLVQPYRVDGQWSNSFTAWKAMGSPQQVTPEQYQTLEKAGQLQLSASPAWHPAIGGKTVLTFDLPQQGVAFFQITW